jgi:CBS domain-containing protein
VPATTALLPVHLRRTLRADGSIQEAISVFCGRKERSISTDLCTDCQRCHVVVLDSDDAPKFVVCESRQPVKHGDPKAAGSPHATPVWAALSRAVLCVEADVAAGRLNTILADAGCDCAPVVDRDGVLLGVISCADLMRWQWRSGAPALAVSALMRPVRPVPATTPVATVGALMASESIDALPVVESDEHPMVVGVITARDVMAWLARRGTQARERRLPGAPMRE